MGIVRCPFVIRNFPFHAPLMFALQVAIADGSSDAAVASPAAGVRAMPTSTTSAFRW